MITIYYHGEFITELNLILSIFENNQTLLRTLMTSSEFLPLIHQTIFLRIKFLYVGFNKKM